MQTKQQLPQRPSCKMIRFGPFAVNFEERELRRSGVRVPLQHKPFRILEILLRRPGALVSRQALAKELWPDLHVDFERSLNSAMNTLRLALEDSRGGPRFIETRWGLGYRFIAPIDGAESSTSLSKTQAHHDCLRGRHFLNRMTGEAVQRAIGFFQAALEEFPGFAPAYAGLADAYCQSAFNGMVTAANVCACARDSANAALENDPDLAEAHVSMGRVLMIFDWDWSQAREHLGRAQDLDPMLPETYRAGALLFAACGRHDDALREIKHAEELDPLSLAAGFEQAWLLYLSGRFHEALAQAWRVLTIEPSFSPAQMVLGLANHQLGAWEDALIELENACLCSGRHPAAVAALGHVYGGGGSVEKARDALNELAEQSKHRHVSRYWFALIHAGMNNRDMAMEELQNASVHREPPLLWMNVDPRLFALHSHAEFAGLRRSLKFG